MSDQDKSELIQLIAEVVEQSTASSKKIDVRWNKYKILTLVLCSFGSVFGAGAWFGDWRGWRIDVDKDRQEFRTHIDNSQSEKNILRAEYNKSIVVKKIEP